MRNLIFIFALMMLAGCGVEKVQYKATADTAMQKPTYEEAVNYYETNAKKNIMSHSYYAGLADVHFAYGRFGSAVNDYTRALRLSGRYEYHLMRGRAYMKLNYYKDAIYDFTIVIEGKGYKFPMAYAERAKAYAATGDFKRAHKDLEKAVKRGGEDAKFLLAMSELTFQMGRIDDAKSYVQKAIAADPESSDMYLMRAKIFYKTKDANQAVSDLEKALDMNPEDSEAKRTLAWIYATNPISSYRNGERALQLALELYQPGKEVMYSEVLAAAYAESGNSAKAVEILEEGIRLSSDLVQQEDFRFDIKNYKEGKPVRTW